MTESIRGQSTVVGSVLLAAVVVVAISLFGVTVLNTVDTEEQQLTDVSVTATTESVTISHAGGEPIAAADLAAVVRFDGRSERYNAAAAGVGTPFKIGDQWVINASLPYDETDVGEYVSVTVIAVNTNEMLYTDAKEIT